MYMLYLHGSRVLGCTWVQGARLYLGPGCQVQCCILSTLLIVACIKFSNFKILFLYHNTHSMHNLPLEQLTWMLFDPSMTIPLPNFAMGKGMAKRARPVGQVCHVLLCWYAYKHTRDTKP